MITNSIRPIKKKNITEIVFQQLLNQIVSGYWAPGDRLPSENELCKMLNVSRISIRAALNRLNGLGMIETRQGEGSFIKLASADIILNPLLPKVLLEPMNMLHIMEYRKIIESGTVALVVDIIQPQDIIRLETIIDEMEKNKQNIELFALNDFKFHFELAEISGNSMIIKVMEVMQLVLQESVMNMVPLVGPDHGIYYHRMILEALKEKDKDKAKNSMEEHIDSNIRKLKELLG